MNMMSWILAVTVLSLGLIASSESHHQDFQQPLSPGSRHHEPTTRLNFSSTSPQIFHSTFALLQQWPNTFFPNGHTIAPCVIKKNTNLYHARVGDKQPPSPEWLSMDIEMSYWIAGTWSDSHMLIYRTTRDIQCLYFDGTSAALFGEGSMDSQMLLIHNSSANVPEPPHWGPPPDDGEPPDEPPDGPPGDDNKNEKWNPLEEEYKRATGLCDFIKRKDLGGLGWGYEGIVRMNAGFEVIWCNFSSPSLHLVSHLNVSAPSLVGVEDDEPHWGPPQDPPEDGVPPNGAPFQPGNSNPFRKHASWDWFKITARRYGLSGSMPGRGEARIVVNSCALFSFYDASLEDQTHARLDEERQSFNLTEEGYWQAPTHPNERAIALRKLMHRRRDERPSNVSDSDGTYMLKSFEERMRMTLDTSTSHCSGIDWINIAQEMVAATSPDLWLLHQRFSELLNAIDGHELRGKLKSVRNILHSITMPFYEYPAWSKETLDEDFDIHSPSAQAALRRCTTQYDPLDEEYLSDSEKLILTSITDVLSAICGVSLSAHLTTEHLWLAHFNNVTAPPPPPHVQDKIKVSVKTSFDVLEELMAWLGWADQWIACEPGCSMGEVCYIPTWPLLGRNIPGLLATRDVKGGRPWRDIDQGLWEPRCTNEETFPY